MRKKLRRDPGGWKRRCDSSSPYRSSALRDIHSLYTNLEAPVILPAITDHTNSHGGRHATCRFCVDAICARVNLRLGHGFYTFLSLPHKILFMVFAKQLRAGVRRGEITCSIRIWMRPHVRVGARYRMEEGEIEVDSIKPISFPDITPELARESRTQSISAS